MSRGDTWHSPLVSAAALPHSRPKSPPEGRGRAGSSGWRTGESDNGRPAQWHSSCGVWDWHLPLSASRPHSSALSSAPLRERTFPHRLCATPSRKAGLGVQRKVPFIRWSRTVPLRERHSGAPVESEDLGVSSSGSVSYSISGTEPVRAKTWSRIMQRVEWNWLMTNWA